MASVAVAIKRLSKEKKKLDASRVCDYYVIPLEENIFEWHFTLKGPSDSPYEEGLYHGALRFPRNYPFSPPDIVFLTASGRFEVGVNICSSISSYHPEKWQPTYDIELVLTALRSFMAQDEERGIGSLIKRYVDDEEKKQLAKNSHEFKCTKCGMKSAWDVWITEMKQHPPVLPTAAAAAAVKTNDDGDGDGDDENSGNNNNNENGNGNDGGGGSTCGEMRLLINNNNNESNNNNNKNNNSGSSSSSRGDITRRENNENNNDHDDNNNKKSKNKDIGLINDHEDKKMLITQIL